MVKDLIRFGLELHVQFITSPSCCHRLNCEQGVSMQASLLRLLHVGGVWECAQTLFYMLILVSHVTHWNSKVVYKFNKTNKTQ